MSCSGRLKKNGLVDNCHGAFLGNIFIPSLPMSDTDSRTDSHMPSVIDVSAENYHNDSRPSLVEVRPVVNAFDRGTHQASTDEFKTDKSALLCDTADRTASEFFMRSRLFLVNSDTRSLVHY